MIRNIKTSPSRAKKTYVLINGHVATRDQVLAEGDQVRIFQLLAGG
jgi:sulfur carrier protein ThiS